MRGCSLARDSVYYLGKFRTKFPKQRANAETQCRCTGTNTKTVFMMVPQIIDCSRLFKLFACCRDFDGKELFYELVLGETSSRAINNSETCHKQSWLVFILKS